MYQQVKSMTKAILPKWIKKQLFQGLAILNYPKNMFIYSKAKKKRVERNIPPDYHFRILEYNRNLLPNAYLAEIEAINSNPHSIARIGHTVGYPSWNLLYFSILCSFPVEKREFFIVETGTNYGFSTIIMAQILKDKGVQGIVRTVDIDENIVEIARNNVEKAGLSQYVEFHVQDSLTYLAELANETEYIDFAFLDSNHEYNHVKKEFSIIYPMIVASKGKVYFDNTTSGGVARALQFIKYAYGGNMIEFKYCSSSPPGNVIWQPA